MADLDFDAAVRWARFDPRRTLARRTDADLAFASEEQLAGGPLLLDTCVYIDQLQGRAPDILDAVVAARQINHSTVAQQELMHTVGVLDPKDPRTSGAIALIREVIQSMPAHRTLVPDGDVLGRAALLSGMLCRLQGFGAGRRLRALQDCVLFLQARKLGLTVLTANISDFDLLTQLVPSALVLFYRNTSGG